MAHVEVEADQALADVQASVEQATGILMQQQRFLVVGALLPSR